MSAVFKSCARLLCALVLAAVLLAVCPALADGQTYSPIITKPDDGQPKPTTAPVINVRDYPWVYHIIGDDCYLDEYYGTESTVTVPARLGGRKVVQFGSDKQDLMNSYVTRVVFEEGIESLNGWYALNGCEETLESVVFPGTLKAIPQGICASCKRLESVTLGEGTSSIEPSAFSGCAWLMEIQIPSSVVTIGDAAFASCKSLASVRFAGDSRLTAVCEYAFYNCPQLRKITLPKSVREIRDQAFLKTGITELSVPDGTKRLGFDLATGLSKIYIPDSVQTISSIRHIGYYIEGTSSMPTSLGDPGSLTVYCNEYSYADAYATAKGYKTVYVDAEPFSQYGKITVEDITLGNAGETAQARYYAFPDIGAPTFSSSNRKVFTVSSAGAVTGVGRGTATLGVKLGDYTAHANVTVRVPIRDFTLRDIYMVAKQPAQVLPDTVPENADASFSYTTGNAVLATVDKDGNITARGVCDTTITVSESTTGITRTCPLHVCYPVTAIAFEQDAVSVPPLESVQLIANVTSRDTTCQNQLVEFSSDDEAVATVDRRGVVTGVAPGVANITAAASNGVKARCKVTVSGYASVILPSGTTEIGDEAFYGDRFGVVYVPQGCLSIGSRAFAGNLDLRRIYLPDSVEYISNSAFNQCYSLVIVAPKYSYAAKWARANGIELIER